MYYFASDIHLGAGDKECARRVESRFVEWLDSVAGDAETIYLLGDIFDFWYEYRRVVPKGFVRTLAKLAELTSRGIRVVFLTGNHDMWVRDYLAEECGIEVYTKPIIEQVAGKRLFLAHGDNMMIDGMPMLKLMNFLFRSKVARVLFSWLIHPDLALKFGHWWSGKSRKAHGGEIPETVNDALGRYAEELSAREGIDICVFGHTHKSELRQCGEASVLFLSEWEHRPAYGVMSPDGEIKLCDLKF